MYIKSWNTSNASDCWFGLQFVSSQHDNGPMPTLSEPPCHNSNNTGMPAATCEDQCRVGIWITCLFYLFRCSELNTSLFSLTLPI